MSRIGKMPIVIPAGIEVSVDGNNLVQVKSKTATLFRTVDREIKVSVEGDQLLVTRPTEQKRHKALHGLYRSLLFNMVKGASEGFKTQMEVVGVGYRAAATGQVLEITVGFSHPIVFKMPDEVKVTAEMPKGVPPIITMISADKQLLGQVAARIRSIRFPEPYKGKGIRFMGEILRRKAGKSASKAKK